MKDSKVGDMRLRSRCNKFRLQDERSAQRTLMLDAAVGSGWRSSQLRPANGSEGIGKRKRVDATRASVVNMKVTKVT